MESNVSSGQSGWHSCHRGVSANLRQAIAASFICAVWALPTWAATTWNVPGDGSNTCTVANPSCDTIAGAVAAASGGDTVDLAAGSHNTTAQVVIDKNLTLRGAGAGSSTVTLSFDTGSSGDSRGWFLVDSGITFTIQDLTLDGSGQKVWQAIRHKGQGSVTNCAISNIKFEESGPSYAGTGIAAFGTGNVNVSNSTFSQIGRVGILYFGTTISGSTYTGNTYAGKGVGDFLDYGVEVGAGANATITNSEISGNLGVASADGSTSAGILVTTYYGAGTQATIANNKISGSTTAIAVGFDASDTSTVAAHSNSFTGNGEAIFTTAPAVDAEGNWYDSTTGPTHLTNSGGSGEAVNDGVDYSPWLKSGTDCNPGTPGFQVCTTYVVNPNNPPTYTTGGIQDGVDFAAAGDTVEAVAGTYTEQVTVNKSLSLQGAGAGSSIIKAPGVLVGDANGSMNVVTITGGSVNVELSGVTVSGPGPSGCGSINIGIFVRDGANANIHDNAISDIRDEPLSGCQNGQGVWVGRNLFSTTGTATITNNVITGYQKGGIVVDRTGSSATITGNTVTGVGATPSIAQNGIQVSRGAVASLSGNTISGNLCNHASCGPDPVNETQSAGILLFQAGNGTSISGSPSISNNDIGIYNLATGTIINGNQLSNNRVLSAGVHSLTPSRR